MCGRYVRRSDKQKIAEHFHARPVGDLPMQYADFNIAPSTHQPIIRHSKENGGREMLLARWETEVLAKIPEVRQRQVSEMVKSFFVVLDAAEGR